MPGRQLCKKIKMRDEIWDDIEKEVSGKKQMYDLEIREGERRP